MYTFMILAILYAYKNVIILCTTILLKITLELNKFTIIETIIYLFITQIVDLFFRLSAP